MSDIIELTMDQGTIEWHEARSGIVTSTKLKQAIGNEGPQQTLMYQLISERMAQQVFDDFSTAAMAHGNDTEDMAREVASEATGKSFEKIGMLLSPIIKGFGISPDGVHRVDGKIVGGIEIKCPNSKAHVEYFMNGEIPKIYQAQMLAPFLLSDDIREWTFMSYDYRNYSFPEFYITVKRDGIYDEVLAARDKLSDFIADVDDKHMKLLLGEEIKTSIFADDGLDTGRCKDCNEKLDVGDSLLLVDQCSECLERLGR